MAKKQKWYVVWEGHNPGIYTTWNACQQEIKNVPNAKYKSFKSREEAEIAFSSDPSFILSKKPQSQQMVRSIDTLPGIILPSISVDAACSGNPGLLEYRGVDTKTGNEIFRMGPFHDGTNNVGEFLALVHGIAFQKQQGTHLPIYSDSRTAMAWVRNKKLKTTLARTQKNRTLFQLVDRALLWLENNTYSIQIMKWPTKEWGEIPADFGRK